MKLPSHVHLIGICGVATSALAIAFHKRGIKVTGSDKGFFPPVSIELEKQGVPFYAGWHPENMFGGDPLATSENSIVIVGTASGTQNPETAYANERGFRMFSYPEVIGEFFAKEKTIVCAGTWGKTSSSALLSFIMDKAGQDPTYMFGGISLSHESSARLTDSDTAVFEGDEYKSSPTDERAKFFHYKPTHLLLTAVSWDHADLYPTEELYFEAFKKLLAGLPTDGFVVACVDQSGVAGMIDSYKGKVISYGRARPAGSQAVDYEYKNVSQSSNGIKLTISHGGKEYEINSPMLGLYQAENIAGCFAMACEMGISPEKIVTAIAEFKGMKRRMEKRLDSAHSPKGITIIDDIAHSGEKASSALNTLKSIYSEKVICVFEPNIGGRRRESASKYDSAFKDADIVVIPRLTKLKVAEDSSEQPMEGDELAANIGKTHPNVKHIDDDEKLVSYLVSNTQKDDVIAFLGSHGFRGMIEETVGRLK